MPIPQPAKVFTFPARTTETVRTAPEPVAEEMTPIVLTPPEGTETTAATGTTMTAETTEEEPMELDTAMMVETETTAETETMATTTDMMTSETIDEDEGEELLLDSVDMTADETMTDETVPDETMTETADMTAGTGTGTGTRSWLTQDETVAETETETRQTGTLFERMSNIARGAAKAQVAEDQAEEGTRLRGADRDPLDIPRFLNRQNNQ
jgi:cell division protein FtsZ